MKIKYRILLGFLLVVASGFFLLTRWILRDIRPQPMKATEEALADTAMLLASHLEGEIREGRIDTSDLAAAFDRARSRKLSAQIYELIKTGVNLRVYVTDERGTVVFDSDGSREVGKDYSRWNDVYKTMRGKYGARATRTNPKDFYSTVIYVGAPVRAHGKIAGVVTVAKPVESVKLFIIKASQEIVLAGVFACLAAMGVSFLVSTWITRPIRRLTDYALAVRDGRRAALPKLGTGEVGILGGAFEEMRDALEGKKYVEGYVQTLAHEIKSPLSSIQGAAELLHEEMPRENRERFLENIHRESARIHHLVEMMLELASLESRKGLVQVEEVDLAALARESLDELAPQIAKKGLAVRDEMAPSPAVRGERFLLRQALLSLLQNAVDFTPRGGAISITLAQGPSHVEWAVKDTGPGIPEYAKERVFERFYSLQRPDTGRKSTGLGLAIAREVAELHDGEVRLENDPSGGARATLSLPGR